MSPRHGVLALLLLALAYNGCDGDGAEPYVDDDTGFSITYPADWEVWTNVPGLQVVGVNPLESDGLPNRVGVQVEEVPADGPSTLPQYVRASIDAAPLLLEEFEVVSQTSRTLGGRDGMELVYTGRVEQQARRFLAVVTMAGGRAYTVTYSADEANYQAGLGEARDVIESFALT